MASELPVCSTMTPDRGVFRAGNVSDRSRNLPDYAALRCRTALKRTQGTLSVSSNSYLVEVHHRDAVGFGGLCVPACSAELSGEDVSDGVNRVLCRARQPDASAGRP